MKPVPQNVSITRGNKKRINKMDEKINNTQQTIAIVCDEVKNLLLDKNLKYGDSAINPIRIFSKADNIEQINIRIDDKLNRIINNKSDKEDEDVELDLIGYLILKRVANRINNS